MLAVVVALVARDDQDEQQQHVDFADDAQDVQGVGDVAASDDAQEQHAKVGHHVLLVDGAAVLASCTG